MILLPLIVLLVLLVVLFVASGFVRVNEPEPAPAAAGCSGDCVPRSQYVAMQRLASRRLAGWNAANKGLIRLRGILRHSQTFNEAICLAVIVYGHPEIKRK